MNFSNLQDWTCQQDIVAELALNLKQQHTNVIGKHKLVRITGNNLSTTLILKCQFPQKV